MVGLLFIAVALGLMMAMLLLITAAFTVVVKIYHPKWSWKRCAKYTTLIS